MSTLSRLLACVAIFFGSAASAQTQAQTTGAERVAVARMIFEGKIPEGLRDLFAQRLMEGLSAARFEVLSGKDVQQKLVQEKDLLACQDASCYPAMAKTLDASYLITARVAESNKTYTMLMEIINGRTGAVLASNRERCETCGVEEAGEKMGLAASALRERLEVVSRAPARFVIRSKPAGATVIIDDQVIGVTPLDSELSGGPHRMKLRMSGFDDLVRSFVVVSGVDESMDLDLVAIPSHFPFRKAGWGGVAAGAALLIAGIVTMTIDHDEVSCGSASKDPNGHCPQVWGTKWWGASMIGLGAAAATVGGVFLYLAPRPGTTTLGATAGLSGSF
jgi:hypothetical protein